MGFQHTAARRRLRIVCSACQVFVDVSTHSRAEAAAWGILYFEKIKKHCFNTQPRGGGCFGDDEVVFILDVSTHSRAEAAAHA